VKLQGEEKKFKRTIVIMKKNRRKKNMNKARGDSRAHKIERISS
jgi:hypothetical protein